MLSNGSRYLQFIAVATMATLISLTPGAHAQDSGTADAAEKPYRIDPDGTTDWATFNGFRRYNGNCLACHGPDGAGSSFGPALMESLKRLSYEQFFETVVNGKSDVNTATTLKMPALGTDRNVMCYIDDIYAYLKARSDGALGGGRPAKHDAKPPEAAEAEAACMAN
nr:c-type cytochrome, methanol metabolism-related [uncultured Dongia sp.]